MFGKIFESIRKNPDHIKKEHKKCEVKYEDKAKTIIVTSKGKYKKDRKLTYDQRKKRIEKKK